MGIYNPEININIITACSRPENLPQLYDSLSWLKCQWWIVFDMERIPKQFTDDPKWKQNWIHIRALRAGLTGYTQRNLALDLITDGWVWVLDDDNIMHPDFIKLIDHLNSPGIEGVIFSQQLGPDPEQVRHNNETNIKVCQIDQAQFILSCKLIAHHRYQGGYTADGHFIERIYNENKEKFIITNEIFCYYNRLKWTK